MSIHPTIEAFVTYLAAERRYSPLTVRNYRHDVEAFFSWLCPRGEAPDPKRVRTEDIREWIVSLSEGSGMEAASINRSLCSLRAFFRWLRRTGAVERDVSRGVGSLRPPSRLPAYVPDGKMNRVVDDVLEAACGADAIGVRDALIVLLFYTTGVRLAELVGIDVQDFSADMRTLRVRGKGEKERLVPILEPVRVRVLHYLSLIKGQNICNSPAKALFLSRSGERISRSVVYRAVKGELQRSGVQGKCSPHVLRHTFATRLLNDGADMREIQELLGHASLQATQVYTHTSIAALQRAYASAHPRSKKSGAGQ